MAIKTKNTGLYTIESGAVVNSGSLTGLTGITGGARDQIELSELNDDSHRFESGMKNPGQATLTLNFDPATAQHVKMYGYYQDGLTRNWAVGLSDSNAAPTVDTVDATAFDFTDHDRTYLAFAGYVSDFSFDLALNDVVKGTVTIQISGSVDLYVKTP